MSKSLGNVFSIRDILKRYHPEVLRLFVLQSHYKSPLDFSEASLAEARMGMGRFYETLKKMDDALAAKPDFVPVSEEILAGKDKEVFETLKALPVRFAEAMDDDFNTARSVGYLFEAVRAMNGYLGEGGFSATGRSLFVIRTAKDILGEIGRVLGIFLDEPQEYFLKDRNREAAKRGLDVGEIEGLIARRWEARQAKDWNQADEIRQGLAAKGVILKDSPAGTSWSIA